MGARCRDAQEDPRRQPGATLPILTAKTAGVLIPKFTKSGKHLSLRGARRAPKQSRESFAPRTLDCFAALAMTVISGWDKLSNRDTRPTRRLGCSECASPICLGANQESRPLPGKRPAHRLGLFRDDGQENARRAVGAAAALLPGVHRCHVE